MSHEDSKDGMTPVEIVWPTQAQVDSGRFQIGRYADRWKTELALLIIKPRHGLIVSVREISRDDQFFALTVAVEQILFAPADFDASEDLVLSCVWNQPYMSLSPDLISAPYSFYLHFGAEGVDRVRRFSQSRMFRDLKTTELLPGLMRGVFSSTSEIPE